VKRKEGERDKWGKKNELGWPVDFLRAAKTLFAAFQSRKIPLNSVTAEYNKAMDDQSKLYACKAIALPLRLSSKDCLEQHSTEALNGIYSVVSLECGYWRSCGVKYINRG
jgi:hypothetical protein